MYLGHYARFEPRTVGDDLTPGLAARVYDATWMLARQWQLGELTGDDGGTPVSVRHVGAATWCTRYTDAAGSLDLAPGAGPLEAFAGAGPVPLNRTRRVDLGRALARRLRSAGLADRLGAFLSAHPIADGIFAGRIPDGGAVLADLGAGLRAEPPTVPALPGLAVDADLVTACISWLDDCRAILGEAATGAWSDRRLSHRLTVEAHGPAGGMALVADDHGGGSLDWWAFDADPLPADSAAVTVPHDVTTIPTRASFRGMPAARWWQEEDAVIDLGGVEANAADLARMALLQFALVFGNDHFVLPVAMGVGSVFETTHLLVSDTFGVTVAIDPAAHSGSSGRRGEGAERWTMFTPTLVDGSGVAPVFVLPAAGLQLLTGKPVEDVHLLRDELANLAWAVEAVVEGEAGPVRRTEPRPEQPDPPATGPLTYLLGGTVPPNWYPLVPRRTATGDVPELVLEEMADTGERPLGTLVWPGIAIDDDRIPREGRRLQRERILARWTDGTTLHWTRRRATVGRGEGSSGLTFDQVKPSET